jgi:branched-chain amino acid transport system substrate-binding protein
MVVWIALWLPLIGCANEEPILVGFAGELTGRRAELGVDERDGAQLAVDTINEQGGVNGRPIQLVIKDDKGDPETARRVDTELAKQGVVAIIGHATSGQTAAVVDQMNQKQLVLLSPTATSTKFSNQKDYLFRLPPTTDALGQALARHITSQNIRQIVGIYDLGNRAYTESMWAAIQTEFEQSGGDASQDFAFASGETDLRTLIDDVVRTNPKAIVFMASAVDTALMAQHLQTQGSSAQLFGGPWPQTSELLEKGGQAVEGMTISSMFHPQNPYPNFQPFAGQFKARYNRAPEFGAAYAYESVLALAHALKQTQGNADGLPQALAGINNLPGVQGPITINQYGDAHREVYIVKVENGQFKVIDTILPP